MSSTPQPVAATPPPPPTSQGPDEVRVYSHSNLFYWWPVWAVGFIMGGYTWFIDGHLMLTVPDGTVTAHAKEVTWTVASGEDKKVETKTDRDIVVLPPPTDKQKGKGIVGDLPRINDTDEQPREPKIHMTRSKNLGVLFCTVLLLVITITNVPLRGMWSVVVIITIALLAVIIALVGMWEKIVTTLSFLDIRINAGGYFFLSGVLCGIWAIATFLFDRQTYIVFTPNSFRVCQSIGDAEVNYDNIGMTLEKQRGDIFRHFILGLGSGDLIVKTSGAQAHHFNLPNILFIHRKVQAIETMREKRGATAPKNA